MTLGWEGKVEVEGGKRKGEITCLLPYLLASLLPCLLGIE